MASLGVGIVGCGLIGGKRARALGRGHLVACADAIESRARALAASVPGAVVMDCQSVVSDPRVQIVVVATTNDMLTPIAAEAVRSGKHVLVEKPAARSVAELEGLAELARRHERLVRVGFNHRYHPALLKGKEIIDSGLLGPLLVVRGRYGHGGRIGYEREWRAQPEISGGGELIDQGVHLIDLSRWYLNEEFEVVEGFATTMYWDMPVDDNAFLTLRTARGATAFLHVSCSEWKNLFSLEVYGRHGKLHIEGLGGSYGLERITWYRMLPEMGPPDTQSWEYPRQDESWHREFAEFLDDIANNRQPAAGLTAAKAALAVVDQTYRRGIGKIVRT